MARGLFRLWLVATVIWTALCLLMASYDRRPDAITIALEASLVPAAAVFVIGLMLSWAMKGFRR